ncbi:MAG: NADH-quinone oxidoreductase subunit C [bacterium]|nr:NADH-quinone oxidoreductase subunit C [bacterium]
MENDALLNSLQTSFPDAACAIGSDWPEIDIDGSDLLTLIQKLRYDEQWTFDYLFCETCVDWKTHFTMVYHLSSTKHRHSVVLKAKLDHDKPQIESLVGFYKTADMLEREVYDLMGIEFLNHPDLRRLLLTEDWVGYPLRKDYEDPINMIRL